MRRALDILIAAAAALLVAGVAVLRAAPVVAEGRLLDFLPPGYTIQRVRLAGVEAYVDTSLGRSDLATSAVLLALAAFLAWVASILRRRGETSARPFGIAAAFALFLVCDDMLAVHETVGHNLGFLTGVPGVDHPDDAIMGLYALAAAWFCRLHRALAPAGSHARRAWLVAAALGAAAVLLDMLPVDSTRPEEGLEVLCALAMLAGAALTARHALEPGTAGLEAATSRA
jgi:hypothetical protein